MKKSINISTTFDQPDLLEDLVEKLACRRFDAGFSKERMPHNFRGLETSSTEAYASGTVALSDKDENFNVPFITSFLFTCIKGKDDEYKLTWASSMS
ncbi:MAG TPA: hypothetical protein VI461_06550 [Chitinophagaceae bacterium]|nr:hypothetical protein [Chitinophagaceae bacterium]